MTSLWAYVIPLESISPKQKKEKKKKKKSSNWVALLSLSKKPIEYSTVENPGVPEGLLLMVQIP